MVSMIGMPRQSTPWVKVKRLHYTFLGSGILLLYIALHLKISSVVHTRPFDKVTYLSNSTTITVDLRTTDFDLELSKEPESEVSKKPSETDLNVSTEPEPNVSEKPSETDLKVDPFEYRKAKTAFQNLSRRLSSHKNICEALPSSKHLQVNKSFDTGVEPLPYFGAIGAIEEWLKESEETAETDEGDKKSNQDFQTCVLPPPKECDAEKFSVILMSHNLDRLQKMRKGIQSISEWSRTAEIILVWNSERSLLESGRDAKNKWATELLKWDEDKSHPLRIFYALENGLENNLLNRYHPSIKPSQEAMLFFDDDGPFFPELAMDAGFDLWKRNSDVQVGSFPRNIRFISQRMNDEQRQKIHDSVEFTKKGFENVHPDDKLRINELNDQKDGLTTISITPFTEFCPENTSDSLEYNFFVFPPTTAHMLLPSGSFFHRNYACFIWHPVFQELRQYILDHPTHPDDMTISTLIAQLSGRPPRTFPRFVGGEKPTIMEDNNNSTRRLKQTKKSEKEKQYSAKIVPDHSEVTVDQNHRRLLWQQKDWGNMREEAISSISQYFGSINPGSVGWCTGTENVKNDRKLHFTCSPEFPDYNLIPWVNEGALGYDHC